MQMPRIDPHQEGKEDVCKRSFCICSLPPDLLKHRIMPCLNTRALVKLLSTNKYLLKQFVTQALDNSDRARWLDDYWKKLYIAEVSYKCGLSEILHPNLSRFNFETLYEYAKNITNQKMLKSAPFIFKKRYESEVQNFPDTPNSRFNSQLRRQLKDEMTSDLQCPGGCNDWKTAFSYQLGHENLMPGCLVNKIKKKHESITDSFPEDSVWNDLRFEGDEGNARTDKHGTAKVITPRFCPKCENWMVRPVSGGACYWCSGPTIFTSPDVVRVLVQVYVAVDSRPFWYLFFFYKL